MDLAAYQNQSSHHVRFQDHFEKLSRTFCKISTLQKSYVGKNAFPYRIFHSQMLKLTKNQNSFRGDKKRKMKNSKMRQIVLCRVRIFPQGPFFKKNVKKNVALCAFSRRGLFLRKNAFCKIVMLILYKIDKIYFKSINIVMTS